MKTQKNFLFTLSLISMVLLAGCGSSSSKDSTPAAATTPTTVTSVPNTVVTTTATTTDVNGTKIVVLTSYDLNQSTEDATLTMGLHAIKSMSYYVQNNHGEKISDSDLTSIVISLKNPTLGNLRDVNNHKGNSLSFTTNNASVSLETNTHSGIMPIEVNATFLDSNGTSQTLRNVFSIVILSGPPTAMSIEYEGTKHDEANAKFIDRMVVTITDKYSNRVNTHPSLSASAIVGYAAENDTNASTSAATRLYIPKTDAKAATMDPVANTLTTTANLSNVDIYNDIVLTYGSGYTYEYAGKWDFDTVSGHTLNLVDKIDANSSQSGMGFVIGHNYREDFCDVYSTNTKVAFVTVENDRFGDNGTVGVSIHYDYYLTGKDIALGVDTVGYTADRNITSKFGGLKKHTLRSMGFHATNSCIIPAGATTNCKMGILIDNTGLYLKNANFGYELKLGDKIIVNSVTTNMSDIYDCSGDGGIAYVDYNVTNQDVNVSGTVSIDKIILRHEF